MTCDTRGQGHAFKVSHCVVWTLNVTHWHTLFELFYLDEEMRTRVLCDVSSVHDIYTFPFYLSVHFIYDLRGNDLQSRNTNFIPLVLFNLDTERFPLLPRLMAMFGMRRRWEVTDFNWIVFHRLLRWFRATIKLIKAEQSGRQQIVCQNTGKLENFLHPRPARLTCVAGVSVILSDWLRPGDYCVSGEQLILCIHLSGAEITLS